MSTERSITAILVAYNSAAVIAQALQALAGRPEIASIIVVDNCSHDDTCELVAREFPSVKVIENPKNDGFGRANNIGLAKGQTPYALLVNPDAVLEEGAIAALLEAAEQHEDAAILAPLLYDAGGALHRSYKRNVFAREGKRDIYTPPEGDMCADFLSGAVWLLNMKHLRQIGFFDPKIFLYYEDDDLCYRARAAGFGLVLVHGARAVHLMGASSGKSSKASEFNKQKFTTWSRLYFERKHRGDEAAKKLARKLRLNYAFRAAWYTFRFNADKVNRYRGRLAGIWDFELGQSY